VTAPSRAAAFSSEDRECRRGSPRAIGAAYEAAGHRLAAAVMVHAE
jgi:hypothetical protein